MAYEDEQQRSRVVVNTPTSHREVVRTETVRSPDREGISTGAVAAIVVGAVALVTILFLFLMNNRDNTNDNTPVATTQPQQQPIIVQQPAQPAQQPIVVQQPGAPAPVVIQGSSSDPSATTAATEDMNIQTNVDKKLSDDPALSSLGVTALVTSGRVTLTGTVNSEALKLKVERAVNSVKGVRGVDNKIIVIS